MTTDQRADHRDRELDLRPCPEARRWIWAAVAISALGVGFVVRSDGGAGFAVGGVVIAVVFGWMALGMRRCRVIVADDTILIRNVWRRYRLPISSAIERSGGR